MDRNIFEEIQRKKQQIKEFALQAQDKGWLKKERCAEIIKKIDSDVLTIGVIGQMKCGKSTFLNAFIFRDNILPAATTPMTAALSYITYGEEKSVEVEFYSENEWTEQKMMAGRDLDDVDPIEESKIKAAKELVGKSMKIQNELPNLLGSIKSDSFDKLIEYVGANGKYVSITKCVHIKYPAEYLKGIEIVDTPGFNDPVVSREERTSAFLKHADVVLLMLSADRPFDATDRDILFEKARKAGTGKVLIAVNKYENSYENGEITDEIQEQIKTSIEKVRKTYQDDYISQLIKGIDPILLSANMALMARIPMTKIEKDDELKHQWGRVCNIFGISTQLEMLEKSLIGNLEDAVLDVIKKSKLEITLNKAINEILQSGKNIMESNENKLHLIQKQIKDLNVPDAELSEKKKNLDKAQIKISRKIGKLESDLKDEFLEYIRKETRDIEDLTSDKCKRMHKIVDVEKKSTIERKLKDAIYELDRDIKREIEDAHTKIKRIVRDASYDFFADVQTICEKYIDDMDIDTFISTIKSDLRNISDEDIFATEEEVKEEEEENLLLEIGKAFLEGLLEGLLDPINYFTLKERCHISIEETFENIRLKEFLQKLSDIAANNYIQIIKKRLEDELINPLIKQLDEIIENVDKHDKMLSQAKADETQLEEEKKKLKINFEEMESLKYTIAI
jgi:hypothetical protein